MANQLLDREHERIERHAADLDRAAEFAREHERYENGDAREWDDPQAVLDAMHAGEDQALAAIGRLARAVAADPTVRFVGNDDAIKTRANNDWRHAKLNGEGDDGIMKRRQKFFKIVGQQAGTDVPARTHAERLYDATIAANRFPSPTRAQAAKRWARHA